MQNNPAAAVIVAAIGLIVCAIAAISLGLKGHVEAAFLLGFVCIGYGLVFEREWKALQEKKRR